MIEAENLILEVFPGRAEVYVQITPLGDCKPEWRKVAVHFGCGSTRIDLLEEWRYGEKVNIDE